MSRCSTTGKVRFPSARAGHEALRGGAHGSRVYPCRACGGWHTTTKMRKGWALVRLLDRLDAERRASAARRD